MNLYTIYYVIETAGPDQTVFCGFGSRFSYGKDEASARESFIPEMIRLKEDQQQLRKFFRCYGPLEVRIRSVKLVNKTVMPEA